MTYGGTQGATRYSATRALNRGNVGRLKEVWRINVRDSVDLARPDCRNCPVQSRRFEATPVMRRGRLFVSTPMGRLYALSANSGRPLWVFDAHVDQSFVYPEGFTTRGVALWEDSSDTPCSHRVFLGTVDGRITALDVESGAPCRAFGVNGIVESDGTTEARDQSGVSLTSPVAVVNDVVVVGGALRKGGSRLGSALGTVRAYDARTGALRWRFGQDVDQRGMSAWSILTADAARDLVFVPTSSATPQFVGRQRAGRNPGASAVVALRASTGELVWEFQTAHHDLWDYDVAAPPMLVTLRRGDGAVPAVVVGTKSGMIFVLDRLTGRPLYPVTERPVPSTTLPGEESWPTQPFPDPAFRLHSERLTPDSAFGLTAEDRAACRQDIAQLENRGLFTPPSTKETLVWPGFWGGINWDGLAWDPENSTLIVAQKRLAMTIQLIDTATIANTRARPGAEVFLQAGSPYAAIRRPLIAPDGTPCNPPPWSELIAFTLGDTVKERWRVPLGRVPWLRHLKGSEQWGSLTFGGALVTGGGLVFIASGQDDVIRAYDIERGAVLWSAQLPAGGQAAPMTYVIDGRQYVVIVAGGRGNIGTPGDWVVAYALPE